MKYLVRTYTRGTIDYLVEAESTEEAEEMVWENGELVYDDSKDQRGIIESEEWDGEYKDYWVKNK